MAKLVWDDVGGDTDSGRDIVQVKAQSFDEGLLSAVARQLSIAGAEPLVALARLMEWIEIHDQVELVMLSIRNPRLHLASAETLLLRGRAWVHGVHTRYRNSIENGHQLTNTRFLGASLLLSHFLECQGKIGNTDDDIHVQSNEAMTFIAILVASPGFELKNTRPRLRSVRDLI